MPQQTIECPDCGGTMMLKGGRCGQFYGCSNWPKCDMTHGAHPDGSPLGFPADKYTRELRMEAHELADRIWNYDIKYQRRRMYAWLGENTPTGHISQLHKEELLDLIDKLKDLIANR